MKTSQNGIDFIKSYEACELSPYICPAGKATIGWGNTFYEDGAKVRITDAPISQSRADRLFDAIIEKFEIEVTKLLSNKFLSQNQFDALVSFVYNIGTQNLKTSTLLKKVNKFKDDKSIPIEFKKWVYSNGKVLNGLVKRREKEADIYSKNLYVNHK